MRTHPLLLAFALILSACDDPKPRTEPAAPASASVSPAASIAVVVPSGGPPLPLDDALPDAAVSAPATSASAAPSASMAVKPKQPDSTETQPKPPVTPPKSSAPAASASAVPTASASAPITPPKAPPARLADPDPAAGALAQRVDDYYLKQTDLVARFEQEFYIRSVGKKKQSSGVMKFKRPHLMKWSYAPPNHNVVVCDGTTVTVYEAENRQYTQQPFSSSEYAGALGFLTGDGIRKYFRFAFHTVQNFTGGKILVGIPIQPHPGYERVLFYVDEAHAHIRRVLIIDVQGNRNRFDFVSVSRQPIDAGEFRWTPPPGVTRIAK